MASANRINHNTTPSTSKQKNVSASSRTLWSDIRRSWRAYVLLSPFLVLIVVFMYYPPLMGFLGSFFEWAPGRQANFVGLDNFRAYLNHPETVRQILNMFILIIVGVVTGVVIPFIGAEMIFSVRSAFIKSFYRFMVAIPMIVPGVVIILLWKHIYDPNLGPINDFLRAIGLEVYARNWLGDPMTALLAIAAVGFPWIAGLSTLVYLGGLSQISESIFDSCLLDGCGGLKRILHIDLPLVLGQVRLLTILSVVGSITAFDRILVMTDGGPGFATMIPALTMYKRAFTSQQFGYASAIGLLIFAVAIVCTVTINKFLKPKT